MKVVIHAPTAEALRRARAFARTLHAKDEEAAIVILANGDGAASAVKEPDSTADRWLVLCECALTELSLIKPPGIESTDNGIFLIAKLQRKGWSYCRA